MRGVSVGIQNQHAGRAQTLRRNSITSNALQQSNDYQRDANDRARDNSHRRRDPIVFERVFDEKDNAEEKREAADPGEKLYAENGLPIECRKRLRRSSQR